MEKPKTIVIQKTIVASTLMTSPQLSKKSFILSGKGCETYHSQSRNLIN